MGKHRLEYDSLETPQTGISCISNDFKYENIYIDADDESIRVENERNYRWQSSEGFGVLDL